ncbi:MAG: hypothetical protein A2504_03335 [Bdellovibrionales bacterium RIFOXYD12_FULL_39_22]|nr:MAG: hypothetical protein A2385_15745 [Bdellovibrionales bacterium RIFOXYB1_FULL_39_21]OFZ41558.1 MAG: hypothetical protein A2485_02435 [Bdellovibrionales bacterium RIFOXYC12_FULL_39_17]OFZ45871.1 MAG: hypothetical protein A2404_12800 [Bdellovibrionales bacterium RIFOXYC1_FULL_39_130]OFZ73540.1 MAG: hypothetical protein A2451_01105 [Bdellovibrionales bacterium RIFOXYC2_FULL_39_8]OFZ74803.1 MAG: hypothetical protein A2560_10230 [Bdellovibrionales bacterium RIFOXYD1_FULL_39_84]OFZ92663.1 MAG:
MAKVSPETAKRYFAAPAKSFFHTIKVEHILGKKILTRAKAKASIFEWTEVIYNRSIIHSTLGYISPVEFERMYFEKVSLPESVFERKINLRLWISWRPIIR